MNVTLTLNASQRMALIELVTEHLQEYNATQTFIDASTGQVTTTAELLKLVIEAPADVQVIHVAAWLGKDGRAVEDVPPGAGRIFLHGLVESLKLQSHYAELLNAHDGGQRKTFPTAAEWLRRLMDVHCDDADSCARCPSSQD